MDERVVGMLFPCLFDSVECSLSVAARIQRRGEIVVALGNVRCEFAGEPVFT